MAERRLAFQNNRELQRFVIPGVRPTGRQLGVGSYGTVEELKVNGLVCAGKRLHEALVEQGNAGVADIARKFLLECQVMAEMRHPHVVQFLGLCFLEGSALPVLVMERLDSSLDDLLETSPGLPLSLKQSLLTDVARGLLYLHTRDPPVVHRDLSAQNVLLTSSLVAKISDLGNARIVNLQPGHLARTLTRVPGAQVYMPPEAFDQHSQYGPQLDIFSFGHLALFILTQVFPGTLAPHTYPDPDNPGRLVGRSEVERRADYIQLLREQLGEQHLLLQLVCQCLHNTPAQRPSAEKLLQQLEALRSQIKGKFAKLQVAMMSVMETEIEEKDSEIERLRRDLWQVQMDRGRLQVEVEVKDIQLQQKDDQIQRQSIELQEKAAQLERQQRELQTLMEDKGKLQAEVEAKDAEIIRKQRELTQQAQEKDAKVYREQRELQELRAEMDDKTACFQQQLGERDAEINQLHRELQCTLGPPASSFRPAWGKRATVTTSAIRDTHVKERKRNAEKRAKHSRSSSSGQKRSEKERERGWEREWEKGRSTPGTPPVLKHLHSQRDSKKEQETALKKLTGNQLRKSVTPDQPVANALKPTTPVQPVADALDEDTICRKTGTIVDELTQNRDFKEAMQCVKEMKSPGMMNVFVRESINHSMEKSALARAHVGKLFGELARGQLLTEEKFIIGLNEVLEYAEDMELDIPKIWDFLAEILALALSQPPLHFHTLTHIYPPLVNVGKAADLVAKVLWQVKLQQSETAALSMWSQSQLEWTSLGVKSEDVEEFLSGQKLEFLQCGEFTRTPPPYFIDLSRLLGSTKVTTDDIFEWIEKNCLEKVAQSPPPSFVRTLTAAMVQATVTGSRATAVFNDDCFKRRLVVLKKYVNENQDLQVEVLCALQLAIAKLEHPPKLLNQMFNLVFDVDVVSEQSFYRWRDNGTKRFGKEIAVLSVQMFFDWLESAETDPDEEREEEEETR